MRLILEVKTRKDMERLKELLSLVSPSPEPVFDDEYDVEPIHFVENFNASHAVEFGEYLHSVFSLSNAPVCDKVVHRLPDPENPLRIMIYGKYQIKGPDSPKKGMDFLMQSAGMHVADELQKVTGSWSVTQHAFTFDSEDESGAYIYILDRDDED